VIAGGGKTWFFLTADYAFGQALERDAAAVVKEQGGEVLGHVLAPLQTHDFSSFLLEAQNSKTQVIALANSGKPYDQCSETGPGVWSYGKRPKARGATNFWPAYRPLLGKPCDRAIQDSSRWVEDRLEAPRNPIDLCLTRLGPQAPETRLAREAHPSRIVAPSEIHRPLA
jgi:hypothetical protein